MNCKQPRAMSHIRRQNQKASSTPPTETPPKSSTINMTNNPSHVSFPNGSYGDFDTRDLNPATILAINGAQTTAEYTFRPPSPPHIHIPQNTEGLQPTRPIFSNVTCSPQEQMILNQIAASNTTISCHPPDWRYESRRKAQSILPYLYLGPQSSAKDIDYLKAEGITLLLVVRNTMSAQAQFMSGQRAADQLGIEHAAIDVAGNQELIAAFPRATKVINDHLIAKYYERARSDDAHNGITTWGKVLVFCETGNERSAAVVAAYIMTMYGQGMIMAAQYVSSSRFCVAYDDGLKHLLQAYEDILGARTSVSRSHLAAPKGKRRLRDDDSDEEMEMGTEWDSTKRDDFERFSGRAAFAPFRD